MKDTFTLSVKFVKITYITVQNISYGRMFIQNVVKDDI